MLRSVLPAAAASFDQLAARVLAGRSSRAKAQSATESLGHEARMEALGQIAAAYGGPTLFDDVDAFFGAPEAARPTLTPVRTQASKDGPVDVRDAGWPSRVDTFVTALGERFREVTQNHTAVARLFTHRGAARPAVILVHGYRAGQFAIEERVWPITWLLDRGFDVALFVLPFHASRAKPGGAPRFPSSDPRVTNEALRQAIHDLRGLVRFFRERGAPHVGAFGMSLGGYTASLLGTVEPLDFLAPIIPLASFADVALASGRFVGTPAEQALQHQGLEAAHRVVSPFARPPRVDPNAVLVVAGASDRVTPPAHAERLRDHFGGALTTFPGGHILQFGRSEGFRAIGRMLRARGLGR